MKQIIQNPILRGFYPDPSVCRRGEDYYLVTSSMEYFPAIPVFHSKDLVHWQQIGHVLTDPDTFDLGECEASGGIMAPTIRFWDGVFYVTCSSEGKNFVCTSTDPLKGWSAPAVLKNTHGIDNSLFFDEDGRCYYQENSPNPEGERFPGDRVIWMQEFDYKNLRLVGEQKIIYKGDGGTWCEAPHLYKKDGWYYLLCAEDGTYRNHSVVCARAKGVWGPYESCPRNPVLTSRHLSREYPVQNVGHLDMIETQAGEWWAFALGSRPYGGFDETQQGDHLAGYYRNLGRETFLVPMTWERGWPVFCPETGRVELTCQRPALPPYRVEAAPQTVLFDETPLDDSWNFLRTPKERWYTLSRKGLTLALRPETLDEKKNPSFIGRRQQHFNFTVETKLCFAPKNDSEKAGLALLHNRHAYMT